MDIFDKLAFMGRRYEPQTVPGTGSRQFSLEDLMAMFGRQSIMELTPYAGNKPGATVRPDAVRKVKVSLLDDGISAIHSDRRDWFQVERTAPSGDVSKVRIVAHAPDGAQVGEIRMTVGGRNYDHYFREDPILQAIDQQQSANQT